MVVVVSMAVAGGCGGPALVPVEGTITLDGSPLAGALVRLDPSTTPQPNTTYVGETDSQGRFAIKLIERDAAGAPADTYRVFITSVKVPPDANEMTKLPPERVPLKYRDGSTSFVVPPAGTTEANFALTSR